MPSLNQLELKNIQQRLSFLILDYIQAPKLQHVVIHESEIYLSTDDVVHALDSAFRAWAPLCASSHGPGSETPSLPLVVELHSDDEGLLGGNGDLDGQVTGLCNVEIAFTDEDTKYKYGWLAHYTFQRDKSNVADL